MRLTEEAQRRVDAEVARMQLDARKLHPERYAPDGEALIRWAGGTWPERLNSWRVAHGLPIIELPHELHPLPTPPPRRANTYSDERSAS